MPRAPLGDARRRLKMALRPAVRAAVKRGPEPPLEHWGLRAQDGHLWADGVDLAALPAAFGSPLHVVLGRRLDENAARFLSARGAAPVEVFYSYKTNPVPGALARLHQQGIGAEVISAFELWLALKLGVPPERILYGGPAKSEDSLRVAVEQGIRLINLNHAEEVELVDRVAREVGRKARVGVRVAPPGGWSGQFGAPLATGEAFDAFKRALAAPHLEVVALHVHRGVLLRREAELEGFLAPVLAFCDELAARLGLELEILDVGGSLAVPSVAGLSEVQKRLTRTFLAPEPSPAPEATIGIEAYVQAVAERVHAHYTAQDRAVPTVFLEPGRALTGDTQLLLSTVHDTKASAEPPSMAILDAGINLAETMLHEYHRVVCANRVDEEPVAPTRLVGPICTPGDVLHPAWTGPALARGDVLAILDAGAYFVPFSTSFSFPQPGIVLVDGDDARLIRRPQTFDDLWERDRVALEGE